MITVVRTYNEEVICISSGIQEEDSVYINVMSESLEEDLTKIDTQGQKSGS